MRRKGNVLVLVFAFVFAFLHFDNRSVSCSETKFMNLQEIDHQMLSLLQSRQYEQLDSKITSYVKDYESDVLREKHLFTAVEVFARSRSDLEPLLSEWISKQPTSYTAYAARGIYYTRVGGAKRGSNTIDKTTEKQLEGMDLYFNKALRDLDKAFSINPRFIHVLPYKMVILGFNGERDEMRQLRQKGVSINPLSSVLRWTFVSGLLPRFGGSIEEMRKEIESIRPYYAKNPDLRVLDGRIAAEYGDQALFFERDNQKAIRFYDEALQYGQESYYHFQRGVAYSRSKQFAPCIKDMDAAIRLRPNNPLAYLERGYAKHRLQLYNEAVVDLTKCIDDDPYEKGAWFTRGNAYSFLGKQDLALTDYENAVLLSPGNRQYLYARDAVKKHLQSKTK